jgi:myo-inositol-hexaphosphate 3-phosphohydrolase
MKTEYTTQELVEKYEVIGRAIDIIAVRDRKTGKEELFTLDQNKYPRTYKKIEDNEA